MEYRCISADCHLDLSWLPHDLFVSNASQAMKDRMPYVTTGPDGPMWTTKSGLNLGLANGKGSAGAVGGRGVKYVAGRGERLDRIAATGLYTDGGKGILRPSTPELRLRDQERDGIQAEVMYGLLHAGNTMTDREASLEFYRIYNDWLSGFCSHDRKRLVGLASIPSHSVDAAVAEARRVAKLGLGGLDVSVSWDMPPLWEPHWDPLWKAASETNLAVHFHTIFVPPSAPLRKDLSERLKVVNQATQVTKKNLASVTILASIIQGGALDRYPDLRVVLGECDIGWIPYVLKRMDLQYEDRFKHGLELKMKPSDYWRHQCRATFQYDPIGVKLLDDLGTETVMWASDFPHDTSTYPDSQEFIDLQFGNLPAEVRRKVTCENAGKFYGLMPS